MSSASKICRTRFNISVRENGLARKCAYFVERPWYSSIFEPVLPDTKQDARSIFRKLRQAPRQLNTVVAGQGEIGDQEPNRLIVSHSLAESLGIARSHQHVESLGRKDARHPIAIAEFVIDNKYGARLVSYLAANVIVFALPSLTGWTSPCCCRHLGWDELRSGAETAHKNFRRADTRLH